MWNRLKRLWYSISFRMTLIILLVFGIGNYYGIKILSVLVSTTTSAQQCVTTSKHLAHSMSATLYLVENTLKSAVLAHSNGMKRYTVLLLCKPLVEQELAYRVYIKPVEETSETLQEILKNEIGYFNDSVSFSEQRSVWTDLYKKDGKPILTVAFNLGNNELLCADIRTEWMRKYIEDSKPQEDAIVSILSHRENYIYHSDTTMLMQKGKRYQFTRETNENGFTFNIQSDHPETINADSFYSAASLFFGSDIEPTDWYINCEIPRDSPFGGFSTFIQYSVVTIYSIILFLSALIILLCSRHLVKPIRKITDATQEIAKGNFNAPLPVISVHTDVRLLRDSFESMQEKLARYVEDIKQATEQKASMDRDLQIAQEIQQGLLHQTFPAFPNRTDIDIYGLQLPAKKVGGDLFDFIMRENKLFFCIGDVAGKGVPAALFMAVTCNLFRYSSKRSVDPAAIVSAISNQLQQGNESNMFCTLFVGIMDMETGELNYCNAGQNGPIFIHDGKCTIIKPNGDIPAGLIEGYKYKNENKVLVPGDSIFLYTDGVTEAENRDKKLFGEEALLEVVDRCKNASMSDLAENVRYEVSAFVDFAEQSDDFTILCLKYKP